MVPQLGRVRSLLFAFDPPGLLRFGRTAARHAGAKAWRFWLAGERVTVLADPALSSAVLSSGRVRMFKGDELAHFLGAASPLLTEGDTQKRVMRAMASETGWSASRTDNALSLAAASLRLKLQGAEVDLAPLLNRAARLFAATMFAAQCTWAIAEFMEAADTPALVCPPLRRLSLRWRRLAPAREQFVEVLRLNHRLSAAAADAAVTTAVGMIDGPVMLTMHALLELTRELCGARVLHEASGAEVAHEMTKALIHLRRARCVLRQPVEAASDLIRRAVVNAAAIPTVPLLLREATEYFQVGGLEFKAGEAVAVDAEKASMPFGHGPHACPGQDLGMRFAEKMLEVIVAQGYAPDPKSLVQRRVRLHYGPARLIVRLR